MPLIHVKDAAEAFVDLAAAPKDQIKTVNYLAIGPTPTPSAQELVDLLKSKIPGTQLAFNVNERVQQIMDAGARLPMEDRFARQEWGWQPVYDLNGIIDDFLAEMKP